MDQKKVSVYKIGIVTIVILSIYIHIPLAQKLPEFKTIKNPKPNIFEKGYVRLKKFKSIPGDLGNDYFLYMPTSLTIDQDNNIYVYEKYEAKIYKLSKDFKLLKTFGRKGEGPGEFKPGVRGFEENINIGGDGRLYVNNASGFKIIVFDLNGRYIREHKITQLWYIDIVVDKNGNFYNYSKEKGVIDVFDKDMNVLHSLLDREEYYTYLFRPPDSEDKRILFLTDFWELPEFNLAVNDQLIVYLRNSSKFFLLKNGEIMNEVHLFPEEALKRAKKKMKERLRRIKKEPKIHLGATCLFGGLIMDEDDKRSFYLGASTTEKDKDILFFYKFDLSGKLIKILYTEKNKDDPYPKFICKKNGIFYAFEESNISLYKEVK